MARRLGGPSDWNHRLKVPNPADEAEENPHTAIVDAFAPPRRPQTTARLGLNLSR
jgi:hypothetical protein